MVPRATPLCALPSRREFLRLVALGGTLVFAGGLVAACQDGENTGGLTGPGTGATLTLDFSKGDVALLQLLYVLEQVEADFYSRLVAELDRSDFTTSDKLALTDIARHEAIHRDVLAATLGADANVRVTPAFGGIGFTARADALAAARTFEDIQVAAYNGVAPLFAGATNFALVAKIASVKGRHSSAIRDLLTPLTAGFASTPTDGALSLSDVAVALQPFIIEKLAFKGEPATLTMVPAASTASLGATDVVDALRVSLLLAQLQAAFYARGTSTTGLIPASDATVIATIASHKTAHVAQLQSLLNQRGAAPSARPAFDFTAKGNLPGFAFLATQNGTFLMLAQALEDLGVRALKGQLRTAFEDKGALSSGLTIHSVQARHASEIRRLRGKKGWITGNNRDDLPAFLQVIYDGEENTMHGTVNALSVGAAAGGATSATEAFDEPLTGAQVTTILALFLQ